MMLFGWFLFSQYKMFDNDRWWWNSTAEKKINHHHAFTQKHRIPYCTDHTHNVFDRISTGKIIWEKNLLFLTVFGFFVWWIKFVANFFWSKKKIDWNFKQHKTKRQYIFGSLVRRINTHTYTVAQNKRGKMMRGCFFM